MLFHHASQEPDTDRRTVVATLQPWIVEASMPYAEWYFGDADSAAEMMRHWMERPSSELYIGRAMLMMETVEQPLGCVIGMSGTELASCRAKDFAAFCEAVDSNPEADDLIAQTIEVSRELFPPVEDDEFYISRVAVDPQRRGRGLGRSMLQHAIEAQRAQGFSRFSLDVSAENAAAIQMYESLGMRVLRKGTSPDAGLQYYRLALTD